VRCRAVLPGQGRGGLQALLQQRELRGMSLSVRAVAALLHVFSLCVLALVSLSFRVGSLPFFLQPEKSFLRVLRSMGQKEHHLCWSRCREVVPRQ